MKDIIYNFISASAYPFYRIISIMAWSESNIEWLAKWIVISSVHLKEESELYVCLGMNCSIQI